MSSAVIVGGSDVQVITNRPLRERRVIDVEHECRLARAGLYALVEVPLRVGLDRLNLGRVASVFIIRLDLVLDLTQVR